MLQGTVERNEDVQWLQRLGAVLAVLASWLWDREVC